MLLYTKNGVDLKFTLRDQFLLRLVKVDVRSKRIVLVNKILT